ncbi:hypothetical protein Glove_195g9 [Diversispora epigaea]|uniref:Uncharacterized protein n=1 Tax=Diversispora epigaea TaxID=1348612 RepID=A0A397INP6_9GLOM|nr:hypothetical protein Glove_195g9 [Diversispora epigaea]
MYGATKLLTSDIWTKFQQIFEESGFEVNISENINEKVAENRRLVVNELMERTRDVYWRIEEKGNDEQTDIFLNELRSCLVLNNTFGQNFNKFLKKVGLRYTHYELTEVNISENINEKVAENRRLVVNELMERTRDVYWRIEEKGNDEQTDIFLNELRSCLVLNNVKAK